jgi:hypothetical protein
MAEMSKLLMMAGAVAAGTEPGAEQVSAYVVLSDGGTTLDLRRFEEKLKNDLSGLGPLRPAEASWACELVRVHLRCDLGL